MLACLPMVLAGCEHALWGNTVALGMSVFLFVGTLQLGKRSTGSASRTDTKSGG